MHISVVGDADANEDKMHTDPNENLRESSNSVVRSGGEECGLFCWVGWSRRRKQTQNGMVR